MSWIKEIKINDAKGLLQKEYNAALNRSGRIWNIVKWMSIHPEAMKSSMELYKCLMFAPSPLNRSEREMLAVVVSARNGCVYWILAHVHDLRAEVEKDFKGLIKQNMIYWCIWLQRTGKKPIFPNGTKFYVILQKRSQRPLSRWNLKIFLH